MLGNIPKIRKEIKDVSMSNLKDFLEDVRKNSAKIGMVAMKQVDSRQTFIGVYFISLAMNLHL